MDNNTTSGPTLLVTATKVQYNATFEAARHTVLEGSGAKQEFFLNSLRDSTTSVDSLEFRVRRLGAKLGRDERPVGVFINSMYHPHEGAPQPVSPMDRITAFLATDPSPPELYTAMCGLPEVPQSNDRR